MGLSLPAQAIGTSEKLQALEQALASPALARAGQLRALLRYLCDKEMQGEAGLLTEYRIGVEALGLPSDYSPAEDSTVRNRAYTLRRKLDELYRSDLANATVRIELTKGSYVPKFTLHAAPEANLEPVLIQPRPAIAAPRRSTGWMIPALVAAGALLVIGAAFFLYRSSTPKIDPIVAQAWGPLLAPDANTLVGLATSLQLVVREAEHPPVSNVYTPAAPVPPDAAKWYRRLRNVDPNARLFLFPTQNSLGVGDAIAATVAVRTLANAGASFQVLPERLVPFAATRKRNAIIIGSPEDSESISKRLARAPLRVEPAGSDGDFKIVEYDRQGRPTGRSFSATRDSQRNLTSAYGLLTILPSEGSAGQQKTLIVSRTHSAGTQAALDFFATPESLRDLLKKMGRDAFPPAYQVVVRTSTDSTLPLSFSYAASAVLEE